MIQRYIGEDLIWKLRATNPYEVNSAAGVSVRYFVDTVEQARAIEEFLRIHISAEYIQGTLYHETKHYPTTISIRNAFGNVSTVDISVI